MDKLGIRMKCHGYVEVNGTKLPFENKVDSSFLLALANQLDAQGLTRNDASNNDSRLLGTASTFQLLGDNADPSMTKLYEGLGVATIDSFTCTQSTFLKTTVRGNGTITKTGVMNSAGFNVVEKTPVSPNPIVLRVGRRNKVNISGGLTLSETDWWVYHPTNKALYTYVGYSIKKIPYDAETGVIGVEETLFTFPNSHNSNRIVTNLKDMVMFIDDRISLNNVKIFDFISETLRNYTISEYLAGSAHFVYDEHNDVVRVPHSVTDGVNSYEGMTIDFNGVVTLGTGLIQYSGTPLLIGDGYMNCDNGEIYSSTTPSRTVLGSVREAYYVQGYSNRKSNYIYDSTGLAMIIAFPTPSNPQYYYVTSMKRFETSMTIFQLPSQQVYQGDDFNIVYVFEIIDGR